MITVTTTVFKKATLALIGLACTAGIIFSIGIKGNDTEVQAETTHERRVYVFSEWGMNYNGWDGVLYIHYWGGESSSNWSSCPAMTKVVDDYNYGLYAYSLPAGTDAFMVKTSSGEPAGAYAKSSDILLSEVNIIKGWKITPTSDGEGKRTPVETTIGMTAAQFSGVLAPIDTCSASYAIGYNSYEQLLRLFINDGSADVMSTTEQDKFETQTVADYVSGDLDHSEGKSTTTTIFNKLATMRTFYNTAHGTSLPISNVDLAAESISPKFILAISFISLTAVGAYYVLSRKKHLA